MEELFTILVVITTKMVGVEAGAVPKELVKKSKLHPDGSRRK